MDELRFNEALIAGHLRVVEMIASGARPSDTLDALLKAVETQYPEMMCSVLLVDDNKCVRTCSAPSLPRDYSDKINGQPIGPKAGSCGTAAFRRQSVFVADIATDPLWEDYKEWALPHELRSCWSTPIFGPQDKVLGTFAIYYKRPRLPDAEHLLLIESAARYAAIILSRYQTEQALRESEERFRQLVEAIDDVFWMTDAAKTKVLYVSPSYETMWGRSRESLYRSPDDWLNAVHADDRERVRAASSEQAHRQYREEYRIERPDGRVRWICESAFPIQDAQGRAYRIAGIATDVTERRELERQLRQSQKLDAIGVLSAGIAHDFNNILGVIIGNAELASQDIGPTHSASESMRALVEATHRARSLVQQILAFSRPEAQQKQVIALDVLIGETIRFLRALLPAGVSLTTNVSPEALKILANATQVQQVLINICTNAWHAMEEVRGGSIAIDLRPVAVDSELASRHHELQAGRRYACISVRDTGGGMDAATLKRVFEPFFTTRRPGKGSGLGLSVAHGIMQSHAGAIVIDSELGKGTTVQLFFPATDSAGETVTRANESAYSGAGERIMYIDDEAALVQVTVRILERMGYSVEGFTDPELALDAFRADPARIGLVITDLSMPRMSGLDVSRELLAVRADVPIILTSGYINHDVEEAARRLGVQRVLYKANTVQEFCESVRAVLRSRSES